MSSRRRKRSTPQPSAARPAAPEPAPASRLRRVLPAVALLAVGLVAYVPALRGGFVWDDDYYVTENRTLRSLPGLGQIWFDIGATDQYYPLVYSTFWVEYQLWGARAFGYHLVNVVLHALGAFLLWQVLRRLGVAGAWLAAFAFLLHPVHVESVAWITERKNVLSGVFYAAAILTYLRFAGLDGRAAAPPRRAPLYAATLALFLCALLSKTVSCTLPAALILILWWKKKRLRVSDLLPLFPMFVLGGLMGLVTAWVEKSHVGAEGAAWVAGPLERFLIAGRVLWFYLGKLAWPAEVMFVYPRWSVDSHVPSQYLYPLAAMAALGILWLLRTRLGKGPLVAALFFAGTLFPALGFFDVYAMQYSYVADHFQYHASAGPLAGMAALLILGYRAVLRRFFSEPQRGRTSVPASVGACLAALPILIALGAGTWSQAGVYRDLETFWRDAIAKNPRAWNAHNNLGNLLARTGRTEEAMRHFRTALDIKPDHAYAYNNLGALFVQLGDGRAAIEHYQRALEIIPQLTQARLGIARELEKLGREDETLSHLTRAVELDPRSAAAHQALGVALAQRGSREPAIARLRAAIKLQPDYAEAHSALGALLAGDLRFEEAIVHLARAAELAPEYPPALNNLALALVESGQPARAVEHFRQAIELEPRYVDARLNLAQVLVDLRQTEAAAAEFRAVLELDPANTAAQEGLRLLGGRGAIDVEP